MTAPPEQAESLAQTSLETQVLGKITRRIIPFIVALIFSVS
jgi:hypothetical protein